MKTLPYLTAFSVALCLAGCSTDQQDQAQKNMSQSAQNAYDQTKKAASRGLQSFQEKAAQVSETAKVKSAIGSSDVDTSSVGIDTIDKAVYIFGTVPTKEMKDKADKLAKDIVDKGYTIKDYIEVAAKTE